MKRMLVPIISTTLFLALSLIFALLYFNIQASALWLRQSYDQIALSFLALSVLSFLSFIIPKSKGYGRKLVLPSSISPFALVGFIVSLIIFALFAFVTATSGYIHLSRVAVLTFYSVFSEGHYLFGVFGLIFFVSASLFLTIYFSKKGAIKAFENVLHFFIFPTLIIYELWILVASTREMTIHVVMLIASTPLTNIFTNWFVFILSSGLFAIGLTRIRLIGRSNNQKNEAKQRFPY